MVDLDAGINNPGIESEKVWAGEWNDFVDLDAGSENLGWM